MPVKLAPTRAASDVEIATEKLDPRFCRSPRVGLNRVEPAFCGLGCDPQHRLLVQKNVRLHYAPVAL